MMISGKNKKAFSMRQALKSAFCILKDNLQFFILASLIYSLMMGLTGEVYGLFAPAEKIMNNQLSKPYVYGVTASFLLSVAIFSFILKCSLIQSCLKYFSEGKLKLKNFFYEPLNLFKAFASLICIIALPIMSFLAVGLLFQLFNLLPLPLKAGLISNLIIFPILFIISSLWFVKTAFTAYFIFDCNLNPLVAIKRSLEKTKGKAFGLFVLSALFALIMVSSNLATLYAYTKLGIHLGEPLKANLLVYRAFMAILNVVLFVPINLFGFCFTELVLACIYRQFSPELPVSLQIKNSVPQISLVE